MKLYQVVNAGASLRRLIVQELSLRTAYKLNLLVDQINPHLSYFDSNRERISKLADTGDAELEALLEEDVDINISKVQIRLDEDAKLSAIDVMQLNGFVEFVDVAESGEKSG